VLKTKAANSLAVSTFFSVSVLFIFHNSKTQQ